MKKTTGDITPQKSRWPTSEALHASRNSRFPFEVAAYFLQLLFWVNCGSVIRFFSCTSYPILYCLSYRQVFFMWSVQSAWLVPLSTATEGVLKDSFPLNELVLVKLKALLDFYGKFSDTNVSRLEHELSSLMERPELDPLALSRCKTMALVDLPSIDYLRWAPMLRSAFGTEDIFPQDLIKLACPGYVLGLFNRGSLPRVTDLLNYVLFRIVAALSPFMANATLRDAMSRAYATPGSGPLTPRQLCVRLLDRFEPAVPMYLAANMSLAYLGAEGDVQDLLEGHLQARRASLFRDDGISTRCTFVAWFISYRWRVRV
ncbi:uncharacterized protein LOC142814699 [Rhipicephalus microplus]|uniref:uncharacterized protein LOC142814699 n=1 Tax=Rhipicephalus microplus TaxID=6941 RepID=UPI003F6CAAE4